MREDYDLKITGEGDIINNGARESGFGWMSALSCL